MQACPTCTAEVQQGDGFCGRCGAEQPAPPPPPPSHESEAATPVAAATPSIRLAGYDRQVEHLDPLGDAFPVAAMRQAFAYSVLAAFTAVVLWLLGRMIGANFNSLIGIVFIVAFFAYFLLPIPVSLSEWKTLIEGKGTLAPEVFNHVAHSLKRREAPVTVTIKPLSQPGHPQRDYLRVQHGILSGYVTCFPYGSDLYLGWTLWWRFSPLHYLLMMAGRRWQVVTGRGTELHLLYRYDVAKAMRESMHVAAGEAVAAANGLLPLAPLPADVTVEPVQAPGRLIDVVAPRTAP